MVGNRIKVLARGDRDTLENSFACARHTGLDFVEIGVAVRELLTIG